MIAWDVVDWHAVGRLMLSIVFFGPLCICLATLIMDWLDNH